MANFPFTKIGLLLILTCWTTGSTGAAFSFEEEFLQLKENYVRKIEFDFRANISICKELNKNFIQLC
jgi:hypothetical protein